MLSLGDLASQARQRRRTTPEHVAEVLREAILRGVLRGGQQLQQDALAAQFGVSRIPVREALRQLEAQGLVTVYPHRGAVVSELSPEEVQEIYEIRVALECLALRFAIPHFTDEDLKRAREILDQLDEADEIPRWSELNSEFHSTLYRPAGRPHLLSLINTLRLNVDRYHRIYISLMHYKPTSQREHRRILAACRRRNTEAATGALERHLATAAKRLTSYLRQSQESQERENALKG